MKKVLVLAMVAVLSFSIVGCGKSTEAPVEEETTTGETTTEETTVEEAGEEVATETSGESSGNEAMDAYIKLSQASFDAMAESLKGVMEFKASGEGSTLKYEMKVLADMGDAAKEQVDAQMEVQKPQMEMVVEGLKAAGIENPKFVVEYKDKDDNVIATYDFE